MTPAIPTVDLADWRGADDSRRDEFARALVTGFRRWGLAYVRGGDIAPADLDAFYALFQRFTALPEETKRRYARPDLWFQRGYTPPNTEVAVASDGRPDFKECWFAAPETAALADRWAFPQLYPDNIWPEGFEGADEFRATYLSLAYRLHAIGEILLAGVERGLDLSPGTLRRLTLGGAHVTRALRYVPLTAEQTAQGVLWGEEHTDFNLITLLPGGRFFDPEGQPRLAPDDRSGLFLRTRGSDGEPAGRLVPGRAPSGCITVQVGQQLEILSGGVLQATPHQITAPGVSGFSRCSMAHFVHVHPLTPLYPLDRFLDEATSADYGPPVLAGTYDIKTLVDIGLAPVSTLDVFGYRQYDRLERQRTVRERPG